MSKIWIQTSLDGTNYTTMKSPSSYKIDLEDLDNESYRSIVNGTLVRNRTSKDWVKIQLSWNAILASEVNTLRTAVKTNQKFYCKCHCPELGDNLLQFIGYVSKFSSEVIEDNSDYRKVSFNIIQSDNTSFN